MIDQLVPFQCSANVEREPGSETFEMPTAKQLAVLGDATRLSSAFGTRGLVMIDQLCAVPMLDAIAPGQHVADREATRVARTRNGGRDL